MKPNQNYDNMFSNSIILLVQIGVLDEHIRVKQNHFIESMTLRSNYYFALILLFVLTPIDPGVSRRA